MSILDDLNKRLDELRYDRSRQDQVIEQLKEENAKLKAENEILWEAVKFYADENNWEDTIGSSDYFLCKDPNFVAQKAIKKIKAMKDENEW
jgi:cell division protein FtsB